MPERAVAAIIADQQPVSAEADTSVAEAARIMRSRRVGALLVMEGARLAGIFTERDALFRVIAEGRSPKSTRISEVMTANPQTIGPDRPFAQALVMMHEGGFRHVPVVRNGHPVGMVSARDALSLEWDELALELGRRQQIGESLG